MGRRREYPEFEGMTTDDIIELLRLSKLRSEDKEIAVQCICWGKYDVEAGAEVGYSRAAASWRMREKILPELRKIINTLEARGELRRKTGA